ncbi:MAG: hypothetical protein O3B13_12785 [Planctomycetota bacterium]|nr:hypothetical protein [Planctomycetota bacterium]
MSDLLPPPGKSVLQEATLGLEYRHVIRRSRWSPLLQYLSVTRSLFIGERCNGAVS